MIWATGFRLDHSLVQLPVFDADGRVEHRRGVTAIPGLYFLGLPWLHTRGSALLGWVKDDASVHRRTDRRARRNEQRSGRRARSDSVRATPRATRPRRAAQRDAARIMSDRLDTPAAAVASEANPRSRRSEPAR